MNSYLPHLIPSNCISVNLILGLLLYSIDFFIYIFGKYFILKGLLSLCICLCSSWCQQFLYIWRHTNYFVGWKFPELLMSLWIKQKSMKNYSLQRTSVHWARIITQSLLGFCQNIHDILKTSWKQLIWYTATFIITNRFCSCPMFNTLTVMNWDKTS